MNRQRGAALLIALLVVVLAVTAGLLSAFNSRNSQAAHGDQILVASRDALLGFSVSALNGYRPGDMPFPDTLSKSEAPRNYDGKADTGGCIDSSKSDGTLIPNGEKMRCLGRLPWRDLGLQLPDDSENDPTGVMPWYAVSANLVDPCLKSINPGTLDLAYPSPTSYPADCPGTPTDSRLPHPWLTVRDAQGNILSDRVAFIVILPGPAIGTQSRIPSPNLGEAKEYLDTYAVRVNSTGCPNGANTPCTFRNDDLDNDFIIGDTNDPQNVFNDRLIYVTIDDLIAGAEKRALAEAAAQLRSFYRNSNATAAQRHYPYASDLGGPLFNCKKDLLKGHLPINNGCQCYCTREECGCRNCPTGLLTNAIVTTSSGTFINSDGACSNTSNQCTCNGNGWCRGTNLNQGNAAINVTSPLPFSVSITAPVAALSTLAADAPFTQSIGHCSLNAGSCQCSGTGLSSQSGSCSGNDITALGPTSYRFANNASGRFDITQTTCPHSVPIFPGWFTDNNWSRYVYYTLGSSCSLSSPGCTGATLRAGSQNGVHALLIGTGRPLQVQPTPQPKQTGFPSPSISDYLDSAENTNGDDVYDAVGTHPSSTYNDKAVIVCPGEPSCL